VCVCVCVCVLCVCVCVCVQNGKDYHPGALRAAEAFGLHLTNVAGAN